jgi:acyl carrier protein
MTRDEVRAVIVDELGKIAPDIDAGTVDASADLREAFDIDSMDFLNLVMAIHKRLEIDIPERDYPQLATLNKAIDYAHARNLGAPSGG